MESSCFEGSDQLSVESAEDALAAIGSSPEAERPSILGVPSDDDDEEEEEEEVEGLLGEPRSLLRSNSVLVPASVFNDHSLMQYSTMSPVSHATTLHSCG